MLNKIKEEVCKGNIDLVKKGLVILTWGNVSAFDPITRLVVIKPSGIAYDKMTADDMVVVNLAGKVIEGKWKPSSDTPTHLEIYKSFQNVRSIVHTHSKWATIFAQSKKKLIPYGTTHADYYNQAIEVTRKLTIQEITKNYEENTGKVIVETFKEKGINYLNCPSILVSEHGPFTWGKTVKEAVQNALVLETIAEMAYYTETMKQNKTQMDQNLLEKHFNRKHGNNAYYGQ